jgi:aspartate/methionine/tyrosine aminotransferase
LPQAATASLAEGETFYTWQRGLPELAPGHCRLHALRLTGQALDAERFFVTGSGMQSIQIALQIALDPGDDTIIVPSPAWPNIVAAAGLRQAHVREIAMPFVDGRFTLDMTAIEEAARQPGTRAIFINSPSNPTGWVADLERSRRCTIWPSATICGSLPTRFTPASSMARRPLPGSSPMRAPSFKDVDPLSPRVLYVNTMSKNWAMTGWRIGWLEAPVELAQMVENLIQYSTSGVAAFMQRAAIVALNEGDAFIDEQIPPRHARTAICWQKPSNRSTVCR